MLWCAFGTLALHEASPSTGPGCTPKTPVRQQIKSWRIQTGPNGRNEFLTERGSQLLNETWVSCFAPGKRSQ